MNISKVAKNLEIFILGTNKPKDHWKKYQIKKNKR
tara:strand:- start:3781 stop:3885 length:105 start_codon:yes stop_codon:yes gene_type:complete